MKLTKLLASLILIFAIFASSLSVYAQGDTGTETSDSGENSVEKVDVYAVFWPIVPGKTVADSMFWAKQLKENFGGFFSFGDINQSKFQIELSEKRLVEANKLFEDKDYASAEKSLAMNKQNRDKAVALMKKAYEEKRNVDELKSRLVSSLENQQMVIQYLASQVPEDQASELNQIAEELTLQISESR